MTTGAWFVPILEKLMDEDPNFLKYDMDFLWAD